MSDLISILADMDLNSRPVKIDFLDVGSLDLPAILHWDLNHFVVLKKVKRKALIIICLLYTSDAADE